MYARHRWDRGASSNIDENLVGFEHFIIDANAPGRLESRMSLNHRAVGKSSKPLLHTPVRPPRYFIFTSFDALHVDAHIAVDHKTVFRASASDMGCVGTRNERFCGNTPGIHARSTKLVPFDDRDPHSCRGKPRCQRRTSLAGTDDNGVKVSAHNASAASEPLDSGNSRRGDRSPCRSPACAHI